MKRSCSQTSNARFPRVEALEGRWCPAGLVWQSGGTLHVWGTSGIDHVTIAQNDDTGTITTTMNGDATPSLSAGISHIDVRLYGGSDTLTWKLSGNLFRYDKQVDISLGEGENTANLWFGGSHSGVNSGVVLQGDLNMTVTGGSLTDRVYADFGRTHYCNLSYTANLGEGTDFARANLYGDVINSDVRFELNGEGGTDELSSTNNWDYIADYYGISVNRFSTLEVVMNGGAGTDDLDTLYSGVLDGSFLLRMDGGTEGDTVEADVASQAGSDGSLDAALSGGSGADRMYLRVTGSADVLNALLDGGSGVDMNNTVLTTSNVTVVQFP